MRPTVTVNDVTVNTPIMRVCVIGAGAAGLCCAYNLRRAFIKYVVFEQTDQPGGTWVYNEQADNSVHSSMYRDLRTNLPVEIMGYPGHPFPEEGPSFVHHSTVKKYLDDFYKNQVEPYGNIKHNTKVVAVRRALNDSHWEVDVVEATGDKRTESFTHIMVCNGKYTVPRLPDVPGLETFTGTIEHSHGYRTPEKYVGKRVLIVGGGFSGTDIAQEISSVAKECFLSHGLKAPLKLPNVTEKSLLKRVSRDRMHFASGDILSGLDCLLFCTGYKISAPFLNDLVNVDDGYRVRDLYRHTILITNPTITFIGLPSCIVPFVVFDYQVRLAIEVFTGEMKLPDETEMRKEVEREEAKREKAGLCPRKFAHDMRGNLLWDYLQTFVDDGFGQLDPTVKKGYVAVNEARCKDVVGYRNIKLSL
ncbi:flavin-containing monooxygenase FMO GS-OX5-like isoform X1 [Varroa jacobsoni]|nr:flavin-containing monooxygenase FMO GS-OX5-like isoform X1 [Varroa jacobsoni]